MIKKGTIFSLTVESEDIHYIVVDRLEDIGGGDGGWLCVEKIAVDENGIENTSQFDCWRVTDKYMEAQIQRGVIKIVEN
jgi:hypothetical protein